jgi:DNA-binding transcriptional ArsR family regulator
MVKNQPTAKDANVVPLHPQKSDRKSEKKWGSSVMKLGFCIVPSVLLRAQQRLGLNPTQLAVLLQLADYWWDPNRKPFPSKQALSDRLGLGPRQIQRHIADLEAAGLVKRIERRAAHRGKISNEYDLSGLVERLKKIAPEIDKANEIKRQSTRRGGIKKDVVEE